MVEFRNLTARNNVFGICTRCEEKVFTVLLETCVRTRRSVANPLEAAGPFVGIEDTIELEFTRRQQDGSRENAEFFGSEFRHLPPDIHASWSVRTASVRKTDLSSLQIAFPNDRDRPSRENRRSCMNDNKAAGHVSCGALGWLLTGGQIQNVATVESVRYGGARTEGTAGQLAVIPVASLDVYSRRLGNRSDVPFRGPFGRVGGSLAGGPGGEDVDFFGGRCSGRLEVEKVSTLSEVFNRGGVARSSPESPRVAA